MTTRTKPLTDRIALVAGATRGAGRGIARMLGEAGATVYCTGRGSRARPSAFGVYAGRPETIEETAELVSAAGGTGIAVRVDHADEGEVAALVKRVRREQKRLDLLVNVLGGPQVEDQRPFWKLPPDAGRAMLDAWVWPHVVTARHALPLMVAQRSGLVVEIVEGETLGYHRQLYFDLAMTSLKRLVHALAQELEPHRVAALAVTPGFMRTEVVLAHLQATEENWRDVARRSAAAKGFGFEGSESPAFVGRAVAALAADPDVMRWSGGLYGSWELADRYGFIDVNGESPRWGPYFAKHFPQYTAPSPTGREWRLETREPLTVDG